MENPKSKWLYSSIKYPEYRICDRCAEAFKIHDAEQEWNYCPHFGAEMEVRMEGLKPCPFCGCADIRMAITLRHTEIVCRECKASIMRGSLWGKCESIAAAREEFGKEAIEAWNRRVSE